MPDIVVFIAELFAAFCSVLLPGLPASLPQIGSRSDSLKRLQVTSLTFAPCQPGMSNVTRTSALATVPNQ